MKTKMKLTKKSIAALILTAALIGTTVLAPGLASANGTELNGNELSIEALNPLTEPSGEIGPDEGTLPADTNVLLTGEAVPPTDAAITPESSPSVETGPASEAAISETNQNEVFSTASDTATVSDDAMLLSALENPQITHIHLADGIYTLPRQVAITRSLALSADNLATVFPAASRRHLEIDGAGLTLSFNNVVFDGGNIGGGVLSGYNSRQTDLTMENAVFQNCAAYNPSFKYDFYNHPNNGGAVENYGKLTIEGSRFEGNFANHSGGAVSSIGNLTVRNTIFESNYLLADYGGMGGAVDLSHNLVAQFENCVFNNNHVNLDGFLGRGGAIYATESFLVYGKTDLTINGCRFENNSAITQGGAVCARTNSNLTVSNSSFIGNQIIGSGTDDDVGGGGAIYTFGSFSIAGSTLKNNETGSTAPRGGAIFLHSATMGETINVRDTVFENNHSPQGGALFAFESKMNISGTKFTENSAALFGGAILITGNNANVKISDAAIEHNSANNGGGVYVSVLSNLNLEAVHFIDNTAGKTYDWDLFTALSNEDAAAKAHENTIHHVSYTAPFSNAYNNADICYARSLKNINYFSNTNLADDPEQVTSFAAIEYGKVHLLAANDIEELGWTNGEKVFKGWSTERDGEIITTALYVLSNEMDLYAVWGDPAAAAPVVTQPAIEPPSIVEPNTETPAIEVPAFLPPVVLQVVESVIPGISPVVETLLAAQPAPQAIQDHSTPLDTAQETGEWALLNLVLVSLSVIIALALLVAWALMPSRGKDALVDKKSAGKRIIAWTAIDVLAVVGIALFLMTENMSLNMVLIDKFTIFHAGIVCLQMATVFVAKVQKAHPDADI